MTRKATKPKPHRRVLSRSIAAVAEPLEGRLLLAKTIYVDINAPGPTHDGLTWDTAYLDLVAVHGC